MGQPLSYRLETTADGGPPKKLAIAFSTADVLINGWRLDRIVNRLLEGDLLTVRPSAPQARQAASFPGRYANLDPAKTLVAELTVTPINKLYTNSRNCARNGRNATQTDASKGDLPKPPQP